MNRLILLWDSAELITEAHVYAAHTFAGEALSSRCDPYEPGNELRALFRECNGCSRLLFRREGQADRLRSPARAHCIRVARPHPLHQAGTALRISCRGTMGA